MDPDRKHELFSRLPRRDGPLTEKLCELALTALPADGSAIFIQVGSTIEGPLAAAGAVGAQIAELEHSLGEGPVFDLVDHHRAVSVPDLGAVGENRWPHLRAAALDAGVHAIHSFPLHLGAIHLGAFEIYSVTPGTLAESTLSDCYAIADLTTSTLLFLQAGLADSQFTDLLSSADSDRLRIHQATGMVAEMLDCSISDALARMRGHAFSHNVSLYEVSTQVIERRLRLEL